MSFPNARIEAAAARQWLFILGGSLIVTYIPFIGFLAALLALVSGIVSFLKLNTLFTRITQAAPEQGPLNSWVFPVYAFYGLAAGVAIFIAALATVFTLGLLLGFLFVFAIIIGIGGILISLGVAYVLYQNSGKLERLRQTRDFSQQVPAPASSVYAPIEPAQPASEVQAEKFCENCGAKALTSDKFCQTCGASFSGSSKSIR